PGSSGPSRATALYQLMHLAATLTEAVSTRDVIELAGDQIMPAFRIQSLVVMTSAEGRLRVEGRRGPHPTLMNRLDGAPLSSDNPAAHVLMTGVPGFFSEFAELERGYPTTGLCETVAACAFLPLIVSGHPVGTLVLAYDRPRAFDPEERALLTSIAGLLAQALDRARL
ncbi:GAF domain-containing protein, partial [Streptomyces sp. NRRL WC-3549]|uniref:GAF domain-containing protein n=1 Tax=Streptomyces sp. NRRL WC-3549 TaxID=1463925 RepID=UPI0004C75DBB